MALSIALLGPLEVVVDGNQVAIGGKKPRALLSILASSPNHTASMQGLIDGLWPEGAPASARNSLQSHVSRLRRTLGDRDRVVQLAEHYQLQVQLDELDLLRFESQLEQGRGAREVGELLEADAHFAAASGLWRGEPFPGLEDVAMLMAARRSLQEQHLAALEGGFETRLELDQIDRVLEELPDAISLHPSSAQLRYLQARGLAAAGRVAEALRAINDYRIELVEESGLHLGPQLVDYERQLLQAELEQEPERAPLPVDLARLTAAGLVGRSEAVKAIVEASQAAVFLVGEAGVGKSSLAAAAVEQLADHETQVLYGRCTKRLDSAFQPLNQALSAVGADLPAPAIDVGLSSGSERYRFFAEVADRFRSLGRSIVLVIDDLHWASAPTLALLEHIMAIDRVEGLTVIVTLRQPGPTQVAAQHQLMAELVRRGDAVRFDVAGLSLEDVQTLLERAGLLASTEAAVELLGSTAGNALLVTELVRQAVARGQRAVPPRAARPVPDAIAALVSEQLERLGPDGEPVQLAALLGDEFSLEVLERAAERPSRVLPALELASDLGLVDEVAADVWSFRHGLTRDALQATVGPSRRRRHHERLADAYRDGGQSAADLGRRAYHLCAAGHPGRAVEAVQLSVDVATQRLDQFAAEDALEHLDQAVQMVGLVADLDPELEAEVHLAAARAHHLRFDEANWVASADLAHACALRAGGAELQARAALARAPFWTQGRLDETALERLDLALDRLGPNPEGRARRLLRARLLATLSGFLAVAAGAAPSRRRATLDLAAAARALAAELDDVAVEVSAVNSLIIGLYQRPAAHRQLELCRWLRALDTDETQLVARRWEAPARLMVGDRDGAARAALELIEGSRRFGWQEMEAFGIQFQAMLLLLDGAFDEGLAQATEAVEIGRQHPNFSRILEAQIFWVAYERGGLDELLPFIEAAVEQEPELPSFRSMLGVTLCELDRLDDARAQLEVLARDGFTTIPRDILWTSAIAGSIEMSVRTEAIDHAVVLGRLLAPYAGQVLVVAGSAFVYGAVDRFLAMSAALQGSTDLAIDRFEHAIRLEQQIGGDILAARSSQWRDQLLGG